MIRYLVGYASGVVCLLTGLVLVQGGAPAGLQSQDQPGKAAQQPDAKKQQKTASKEEEERTPKANTKAPPRVDDEDDTPSGPVARVSDLTQEARKATNPVVKKLFEDLSPPHDLVTQVRGTIKVETVPVFVLPNRDVPVGLKVKKIEQGKNNDAITLNNMNTKSLLGFEQVVLERVNEFLKKDLDKKTTSDKEHLTRLEMLQEAEKALVAGILYNRSAKEQGKREHNMWEGVGKQLEQRLADVQLQRLRILTDAKDWNRAFELATALLADSFANREGGQAEKRDVQREVVRLLARQTEDAVKEQKYGEARRRLMQLQEKFPDSPDLEPIRKELRNQATAVLNQAKELRDKNPNEARAKLRMVQEIYPQLPELRDEILRLNKDFPIVAVGVRSLPTNVSPGLAVTDLERQSLDLVFESLVRLAAGRPPGERYQPDLSNDLPQVISLGRTFLLPRDARWDGLPSEQAVRAGDVKYTIGLMSAPNWPGYDLEWAKLMARSPQIEESPFQITLRMQHGYQDPLGLMDFKILPESSGLTAITDKEFARHPVGSGPFRFTGNEAGKCMFVANPHYGVREGREGLPRIREIHLIKSADPIQDFRDQPTFGMLFDPTSAKLKELKAAGLDDIVKFKTLPNRRIYFLALNHRASVFQNENLRRGLAHAIQREEILNNCFREDLQPKPHRAINGPYPPGSWACDPTIQAYSTLIATPELAAAKSTRPAKTTLSLKYPDDDPAVAKACQLIKQQIEKLDPGLTIELQPRTPVQLHHDVEIAHDYQMAYYSHDYPNEAYWLWPLFQYDGVHENFLGYKNDDVLEGLLRKLMGHRNPAQVQQFARQIHQRCFEKVPFVPLWQLDTHVAIRNNLVLPNPNGIDPLAIFRDADKWILTDAK